MPISYTAAQIARLKRDAKNLGRANALNHSQALDQIARTHGWSNWSLLMKHSQPPQELEPAWFHFTRTDEEMRRAVRVVERSPHTKSRSEEVLRRVPDVVAEFVSAQNAVSFAIEYVESLLRLPRFFVASSSTALREMRCWLPYAVIDNEGPRQILVNRRYKPVGSITNDFVAYSAFGHLALALSPDQLGAIAHRADSPGYLYRDAMAPWGSRLDAKAYLDRLHRLQGILER